MYKRSFILVGICIILAVLIQNLCILPPRGQNISPQEHYKKKIILIPLDSRPPCSTYVVEMGKLLNCEVILPPRNLLDYYTQAGKTHLLGQWLLENAKCSDGFIISSDQLLYGGLLASREKKLTLENENNLFAILTKIHQQMPTKPIYLFNILPRMTPPSNINTRKTVKQLMEYSRLVDKISLAYNITDVKKMEKLRASIPKEALNQYERLYAVNEEFNKKSMSLVKAGVVSKLVIAQDDGEAYGIPNLEKRRLYQFIAQNKLDTSKVIITHGADEVATSLLLNMGNALYGRKYHPRIFVEYNTPAAATMIMPYMAVSVERTVAEKIALADGYKVDDLEKADFVLFVHIGDTKWLSTRQKSSQRIKALINSGKNVALVDLSKHFWADETVFPILVRENVPINRLLAYDGWNTVSNSVGNAVAQGAIVTEEEKYAREQKEQIFLRLKNLQILYNHIAEDYFYLKGTIDAVNGYLRQVGVSNVHDLNIDNNYILANDLVERELQREMQNFSYSRAAKQPLLVGNTKIFVHDMKVFAYFPWPRTFEIRTAVNYQATIGR